jgi:DNA replication protein
LNTKEGKSFSGFPEGKVHLTPIPEIFFRELLPQIDNLDELKVTLYAFWLLDHVEGAFRYLRLAHFIQDEVFMNGMSQDAQAAEAALVNALERCIQRGTLLKANVSLADDEVELFFLNSPKGRAAVQAIERGQWRPSADPLIPLEILPEMPNIFRLYEEHIGPLSPMIAESLKLAEQTYPPDWIDEAVRIAVEKNVRNWRYIDVILKRWQEKGRDEHKNRRDTEKDRRRYADWENTD